MELTSTINHRHTNRLCSRTGCSDVALATLSYQYGQSQVWLDDLSEERDPHSYDLCDRHASRMTAPQGWTVFDRRGHQFAPPLVAV